MKYLFIPSSAINLFVALGLASSLLIVHPRSMVDGRSLAKGSTFELTLYSRFAQNNLRSRNTTKVVGFQAIDK